MAEAVLILQRASSGVGGPHSLRGTGCGHAASGPHVSVQQGSVSKPPTVAAPRSQRPPGASPHRPHEPERPQPPPPRALVSDELLPWRQLSEHPWLAPAQSPPSPLRSGFSRCRRSPRGLLGRAQPSDSDPPSAPPTPPWLPSVARPSPSASRRRKREQKISLEGFRDRNRKWQVPLLPTSHWPGLVT